MCAGKGLMVSMDGPGLFLQGLAAYGATGTLLPGRLLLLWLQAPLLHSTQIQH